MHRHILRCALVALGLCAPAAVAAQPRPAAAPSRPSPPGRLALAATQSAIDEVIVPRVEIRARRSAPTTPAEAVVVAVAETIAETIAAPVAEPVAAPTATPAMAPYTIARTEFDTAVRREAWLLAERRGFRNGSAYEDWIRAETGVRARLVAEGVSVR